MCFAFDSLFDSWDIFLLKNCKLFITLMFAITTLLNFDCAGPSLLHRLLIVVLLVEHGLQGAWAQQLWLMGSRAGAHSLQHMGSVAPGHGQHVRSSPTRDRTSVPYVARWILNHWTFMEATYNCFLIKKKFFKLICLLFTQLYPTLSLPPIDCSTPGSSLLFRKEYQSGLPFPPPGDLPDPGIEPIHLLCLLHWQIDSLPLSHAITQMLSVDILSFYIFINQCLLSTTFTNTVLFNNLYFPNLMGFSEYL